MRVGIFLGEILWRMTRHEADDFLMLSILPQFSPARITLAQMVTILERSSLLNMSVGVDIVLPELGHHVINEREACARIADEFANDTGECEGTETAEKIAAAIRARKSDST